MRFAEAVAAFLSALLRRGLSDTLPTSVVEGKISPYKDLFPGPSFIYFFFGTAPHSAKTGGEFAFPNQSFFQRFGQGVGVGGEIEKTRFVVSHFGETPNRPGHRKRPG